MHRILSYQTAMRPNENLNVYITKRICISFVFSIGFFTLICGFLLGKFVVDREQKIKDLQHTEELLILKEINIVKTMLLKTTRNFTEYEHANVYSERIKENIIKCYQENFPIVDEKQLDIYVDKLVDKSVHLLNKCFIELNGYLNKIRD